MIEISDAWLVGTAVLTTLFGFLLAIWMLVIDTDFSRAVREGSFRIENRNVTEIYSYLKQGTILAASLLIALTLLVIVLLAKYA